MNSHERYCNTLRGLTPSHAWRNATLEAMKAAQGNKVRLRRRPLAYTAAAAVLALAVSGGIWWSGRMAADPDGPGTAHTPQSVTTSEPAITPDPEITPTPEPPGSQNESFSIVTDPSQLMGNNPAAGQLEELTRLPVYENPIPTEEEQRALLDQWAEVLGLTVSKTDWYPAQGEDTMGREPTLEAECTDGTWLSLHGLNFLSVYNSPDQTRLEEAALAYLGKSGLEPTQENRETFAYTSEKDAIQVTWLKDPDASLAEQLYSYSFQRIENTYGSRLTICLPPTTDGVDYPLRPAVDAVASFRARDYWGSDYTAYPEQAEILQVTLEYDASQGQPYFQPVYRILFTQDYWDEVIASRMDDGVDTSTFTGVGVAYVPAIEPEYQDEVPYRRYFNDGLAHFTPEDFS